MKGDDNQLLCQEKAAYIVTERKTEHDIAKPGGHIPSPTGRQLCPCSD